MSDAPDPRSLLTLVVPLYNERESLDPLVRELDSVRGSLPCRLEVILVDDGSVDGSWEAVKGLSSGRDWLRALRFLSNQGQTAALSAGIEAARGGLIAFMDADLQNDPRDLPMLVQPILDGRVDAVCGWRVHRRDDALSRKLPSAVANILITRALGLKLHDLGCTLKVFRSEYLEDVHLYGEMHRFIPAYAHAQGARIMEVAVNHRERRFGKSKYGFTRVYKVLIDLLTVKMLNTYGAKPAYFFGKIGIFFFTLGTLAFSLVAYRALALGRTQSTPMIFIMMLMYVASLICLMSGLLAEINIRVLHAVGERRPYKVVDRIGFGEVDPGRGR
jgi:glycosyltransferase involved in cell wall biosynthesis